MFANLVGFGDNIRLRENANNITLLVPHSHVRRASSLLGEAYAIPSILDVLGEYPWLTEMLDKVIDFVELWKVAPKYGLVVEYDLASGEPIRSWHDPTGEVVASVSEAVVGPDGELFLGSFYLGRIKIVDME